MALAPGKYDAELTEALRAARASGEVHGGILIVYGEPGHNGFACQLPAHLLPAVPSVLRSVADQIEADLKKGRV